MSARRSTPSGGSGAEKSLDRGRSSETIFADFGISEPPIFEFSISRFRVLVISEFFRFQSSNGAKWSKALFREAGSFPDRLAELTRLALDGGHLRFHIFGLDRQDLLKVLGVDKFFGEVEGGIDIDFRKAQGFQ